LQILEHLQRIKRNEEENYTCLPNHKNQSGIKKSGHPCAFNSSMNNVLSYLTTVKEFVGGKKLSEEPSPEDTEVNKIQIYHDALANRFLQG
jgi:hypothetical protein